jgi:hypothetical protein
MKHLPEEKVALYNRLTEELTEVEDSYWRLKDIIKTNYKYIRELRDDIERWKETCFRQTDKIHRLYLLCALELMLILVLVIGRIINLW